MIDRYGPWAVIAGASEGVGASFARHLASAGVHVVLVARRPGPLEALADELRGAHGAEVRTASIDLSAPGADAALFEVTAGLDVGLLVYNAGADERIAFFLDSPVEELAAMVERNCVVPLRACHHYAGRMVKRGRGGIVLVTSGAAWAGAARIATYGATKAFDLVLGEALWAELRPRGIDVLSLVLGATDTPALHRALDQAGVTMAGLADPDNVVREAFAQLPKGPTHMVGAGDAAGSNPLGAVSRRDAVLMMSQANAQLFGLE